MAPEVLFFSSPPRRHSSTSDPRWQRQTSPIPNPIVVFSTPPQQPPRPFDNHWSRQLFSSNLAAATAAAASPSLSSPLQTSRNANLMSSPTRHGKNTTRPDEEGLDENSTTTPSSQSFKPPMIMTREPFSFFLDSNTTGTNPGPKFQFTTRAQQTTSASAMLQTHTKSARESRRRMFLEHARTRRDDARTERSTDQVLRMDYVRERREWEAEQERFARSVFEWDGDGMDGVDEDEEEGNEGVSPTEEKEIEELLGFYSVSAPSTGVGDSGASGRGEEQEEFSDDAYDEAFMEVLSQEQVYLRGRKGEGANVGVGAGWTVGSHVVDGAVSQSSQGRNQTDHEMDLS